MNDKSKLTAMQAEFDAVALSEKSGLPLVGMKPLNAAPESIPAPMMGEIATGQLDGDTTPPARGFAAQIQQPDLAKALQRYGLTPEQVAPLGIELLSPLQTMREFSVYDYSIKIAYADIHGQLSTDARTMMPFSRGRILNRHGKSKYQSPRGTVLHAYLQPGRKWAEVAAIGSVVALTEGEFKAIRANMTPSWPVPVIGLPGVDCFYSGSPSNLAQELAPFNWRDREVFIIFDAPMTLQVKQSIQRLAMALLQKYAKPVTLLIERTQTYIDFAADKPGEKMGLDDYLNAGGTWEELKTQRIVFKPDDDDENPLMLEIAVLLGNADPLYVHLGGQWRGLIRKEGQMRTAVAPIKVKITNPKDDKKPLIKPAFPLWLESKRRIELSTVVFHPDKPPKSIVYANGAQCWNEWRGFATLPKENRRLALLFYRFIRLFFSAPVRPSDGSTLDGQQLRRLTPEGRLHRREFIRWLAHFCQFPAVQCFTSWHFVGDEGTGKSVLAELPSRLVGLQNGGHILDGEKLDSQWTGYLSGCLHVCYNEPENKAIHVANRLKNLRTAETIEINVKYGANYTTENHASFSFTSNAYYTTAITSDSRRDWVWAPKWLQTDVYRGKAWSAICGEVASLIANNADMRSAIMFELLHRIDLTGFNPKAPAGSSEAKTVAADLSLSPIAREKKIALGYVLDLIEQHGLAVFTGESWDFMQRELALDELDVNTFRSELRALSAKRGLIYVGSHINMAVSSGSKQIAVWFVGKKDWSNYDIDQKRAALILPNFKF